MNVANLHLIIAEEIGRLYESPNFAEDLKINSSRWVVYASCPGVNLVGV